ncbi:SHOCT domain-containing protein [Anaerosporobacter sp.]
MGLFSKKSCPVCGNQVKGMFCVKIKDKVSLCQECSKKVDMEASMLPFQTVENIKEHFQVRETNKNEFTSFVTTNEIKCSSSFLREDSNMKKWYCSNVKKPENPTLYDYSEIIDYELTEDGDSIRKGGLGRAAAGALLFGGVGAVVGGVTGKKKTKTEIKSMKIRISLSNKYKNQIILEFIPFGTSVKSGSMTYNLYKQEANRVISFLDSLCAKAEVTQQATQTQQVSGADEIMKFKELLDNGIISQEEFDAKKKQILGL